MQKKVSIIIPTYKRSDFLDRAIESCLNQTYKNIEVIVVDDNDADSEYSQNNLNVLSKYDGVKYIKNGKNMGGNYSRNNGVKNSTGDFIAFLDDDDEFLPEKIEKQVELYEQVNDKNCAIVYCYGELIDDNNNKIIEKNDSEGNCLYEHLIHHVAVTSFLLFPKKIFDDGYFFDEKIKACQEGELTLRLLSAGFTIYRVPEVLARRYKHTSGNITSISNNYINNCMPYFNSCLKIADSFDLKRRKKIYLTKFFWIYNMYYTLKDRNGKKEFLRKILSEKKISIITFKAILKYFLNN